MVRAAREWVSFDDPEEEGRRWQIDVTFLLSHWRCIFGDGCQTRAFSYIGDVAPLIADSIDVPAALNQVFNIGADQPTPVNELAVKVAQAMGREPAIRYHEARKEVLHAVADHSRVAEVFGYRATWSLDRGLKQMSEWALRVGPREPSRRADVEIAKNLPPSWA